MLPIFRRIKKPSTSAAACRSIAEEDEGDRSELDVQTAVEDDGESFGEEQEHMLEQYAESLLDEDEELVLEEDEDETTKEGERQILKGIERRIFEGDEERMKHKTHLRGTWEQVFNENHTQNFKWVRF